MNHSNGFPTGNVTFVFTDIESSSRITAALENTRVGIYEERLRDPHRERLQRLVATYNGVEVGREGDGHFLVFQFVADALACVTLFQQELHTNPITYTQDGTTYQIKVRIGVHTSLVQLQPTLRENGLLDYSGGDVNYAARIAALGAGGQIIVSQATYDSARQLRDYLQLPYGVQPWPGRFLKSFSGPHAVYEILYFTGQESKEPGMQWFSEWYRSTRNRLIERTDKETEVLACLVSGRLCTITGIGGAGKTRLAVACAAKLAGLYDTMLFVSLATADLVENPEAVTESRNVAFVAQAIGAALNRKGEEVQPENLFQWLRTKNLLLLLDNYETVACDMVRQYLIKLVTDTVGVSLLVTGRQPVGVDDVEQLVDLNIGMTDQEAHDLFLDRARMKGQLKGDLTSAQETQLSRILALTEKIPLALELAAAHIKRYTLHEIANGIEETPLGKMGTAIAGRGDDYISQNRNRSLKRSLTWSYNLLDTIGQRVLATTSIFADSFDAATLQAVHGDPEATDGLTALQETSLVFYTDGSEENEGYRFRLHRITREFADEYLRSLPTAEVTKRRFVAHYMNVVNSSVKEPNDLSGYPLLDKEWRNILQSAKIAEEIHDSNAVINFARIGSFLNLRGHLAEDETLRSKALDAAERENNPRLHGLLLNNRGATYQTLGRWDEAIDHYEQSLIIAREYGDLDVQSFALNNLGRVYADRGQWDRAISVYGQSLDIKRQLGDYVGEGRTLGNLGTVYLRQGHFQDAMIAYQRALTISREVKPRDRLSEGNMLACIGTIDLQQGRFNEAAIALETSLNISRELKDPTNEGRTLSVLSAVYEAQQRWDEALDAGNDSLRLAREYGNSLSEAQALHNLGTTYLRLGRTMDACECFHQSLNISRRSKYHVVAVQTLNNLAIVNADQGNIVEALALARELVELRKTAQDQVALKEAQDLVVRLMGRAPSVSLLQARRNRKK